MAIESGTPSFVDSEVTDYRWVESGDLIYVLSGNTAKRRASARVFAPGDNQGKEVYSAYSPGANAISPDGRQFCRLKGLAVQAIDPEQTHLNHAMQGNFRLSFCWWSDDSSRCLIQAYHKSIVSLYLYERESGQFDDLTTKMMALGEQAGVLPYPNATSRAWSPNNSWFVVRGSQHHICQIDPWDSLLLNDFAERGIWDLRISPYEDRIAFLSGNPYIYPATLVVGQVHSAEGKLQFEVLQRLIKRDKSPWFWEMGGKQIGFIVGARVEHHTIP